MGFAGQGESCAGGGPGADFWAWSFKRFAFDPVHRIKSKIAAYAAPGLSWFAFNLGQIEGKPL